jgi:hypothetical protein
MITAKFYGHLESQPVFIEVTPLVLYKASEEEQREMHTLPSSGMQV